MVALVAWAAGGCTGKIGPSAIDEGGAPPPPDVEPQVVPASPDVVASEGFCVERAGAELVAVSPEGHAWLMSPSADGVTLRVVDPFSPEGELTYELVVGAADQLVAYDQTSGAAIADGGLWRLDDLARIELASPEGFDGSGALCGDPATNGMLLSNGELFERRDDAQWWGWNPGASGDGTPSRLLHVEGECQTSADVTWMTSADGTLWQVEPAQYLTPVKFEAMVDAAATDAHVAVLDGEELWVGPSEWQRWTFPGDAPQVLAAAADQLWMASGAQLLRFDGVAWAEVTHDLAEPLVQLAAHAGGAWLAGDQQLCHAAVGPMVRIEGIRPHSRSKEFIYPIRVRASVDMDLLVDVDGEPVDLTVDEGSGWLEGEARLPEVGWHVLTATPSSGAARSILVKRLPEEERSWAADIEPIYATSCANANCHEAGQQDPPDLSSYDAWVALSSTIQARVVDAQNMPPPGNEGPEWGEDDIDVIAQWLQGGMLP